MFDGRPEEQAAPVGECGLDDRISLEDLHPAHHGEISGEAPIPVDRRVDFEAVFCSRRKVVGAVSGGRVNGARALFERHIFGENPD